MVAACRNRRRRSGLAAVARFIAAAARTAPLACALLALEWALCANTLEAAASPERMQPASRWDLLGSRFYLGSARPTIELSAIVAAVAGILPAKFQPNSAAGARYQCSFHIFLLMRIPAGQFREITGNTRPPDAIK